MMFWILTIYLLVSVLSLVLFIYDALYSPQGEDVKLGEFLLVVLISFCPLLNIVWLYIIVKEGHENWPFFNKVVIRRSK